MNPIPPIHLSPDTGTITNALDLAAWLRHHSPAWAATESLARKHDMTRIETLELLALTLGLQLEHARAAEPPPPLPGFGICDAKFVVPVSMMDRMLGDPLGVMGTGFEDPVIPWLKATPPPPWLDLGEPSPKSLAPALLIGLGLFLAIAGGVMLMTGHGLAAAICGAACVALLLRASRIPA